GRESRRALLGRTGESPSGALGDTGHIGSVPTTRSDDPETVDREPSHPSGAEHEARSRVPQPVTELASPPMADEPVPADALMVADAPVTRPHHHAGDRRTSAAVLVLMVGFPAALLVAVATGVLAVQGVSRTELVLPLAALVGLGFVVLGVMRFEWFVLAALAVRTLVDVTHVSPTQAQ